MTRAFECDRCKRMSTNLIECRHYVSTGDLASLVWEQEDRVDFDLCISCETDLESLIRDFWDGFLPE